ncbi:hypothetical protein D3C80_1408240 [compost metagenome]
MVSLRVIFGLFSSIPGNTARGTGLPALASARANTPLYSLLSSNARLSPSSSWLRICGLRSPSFTPNFLAACSVVPGMIAPGAIRSPSRASGTPVALLNAAWNAALRLAYQPALKSAKRYSWRS